MAVSKKRRLEIKRVYEAPSRKDGKRILVDRLWPRGLSKEAAAVDIWIKEVAPSSDLRKWFGHDPERWPEFQRRYTKELKVQKALVSELVDLARTEHVTLVFGAKDEERNQAVVLLGLLRKSLART